MRLREVMSQRPEYVSPGITLKEAASLMKRNNIGMLLVADKDRLLGAITDRDIVVRGIAEGKDPKTTKAKDVMTTKAVCCFDDQEVWEAAQVMEERQVRRLAVLDREKRLVGVVSVGDLAVKTDDESISGEVMRYVAARRNDYMIL